MKGLLFLDCERGHRAKRETRNAIKLLLLTVLSFLYRSASSFSTSPMALTGWSPFCKGVWTLQCSYGVVSRCIGWSSITPSLIQKLRLAWLCEVLVDLSEPVYPKPLTNPWGRRRNNILKSSNVTSWECGSVINK